ncbi:MAG TPA: hypothetical protein ENJ84_11300 [Gammaproteobacteria bacterium]|nr:hypothetical protein [Gammaproteobacteria bacterium]
MTNHQDHTAAFAAAFFIANLIFIGLFYLALWLLYGLRYQQASPITRHHLQQALAASTITTTLFIVINSFILLNSGYHSLTGLISLEIYFMLLVPAFLLLGILAFVKAVTGQDFRYPLIARFIRLQH